MYAEIRMPPEDNTSLNPQNPSQAKNTLPVPEIPPIQVIPKPSLQPPLTTTPPTPPEPSLSTVQNPAPQSSQPQSPQQPLTPDKPKKGGKLLLFTILFMFFILMATGGGTLALAYNNYALIKPPKVVSDAIDGFIIAAPIPKPTRIILESTIAKSATLKSADLKTEISISTTAKNSPISSFKLNINGPVDFQNNKTRAAEADISLETKFEGASFNGSASVKTIDNTIYFKINEFPFGSLYQQLVPYKNKWFFYKIPDAYMPKDKQLQDNTKLTEIFSRFIEKSRNWTKTSSESNGDYLLEINPPKQEIDKLILDLVTTISQTEAKNQKILDSVNLEQISKFTEKLSNLKITATASKSDFYLKRANITFDISADGFTLPTANQESLMPSDKATYNFIISTELSNYNKQIVIVPPQDAQDFQKIIDDFSKNPYNSMNLNEEQSPDAKIKNDIGYIATALQSNNIYKTTQGQATYVKDLKDLEPDYLKTLPIPPAETGIISYQYQIEPVTCDGTALNPCKEIALYSPLTQPKVPGNVWCFQSITGNTQELAQKKCLAAKAPEAKTGNGISINELLSPKSPILGSKSSWDLELLKMFSSFVK